MERLSRNPVAFLATLSFVNMLGFASWSALLNNFAKEAVGFGGWEIGILQSVREIPGFLAFTAVFLFMVLREQTLAYISMAVLAFGVAITGYLPTTFGLIAATFVMSVGFHYLETCNQSLSLQILPKDQAPRLLGRIAGIGAMAQFLAYGGMALAWWAFKPSFQTLYTVAGAAGLVLTVAAVLFFQRFQGTVPQRKGIVLRKRYWLYYALTLLSGARRQIFMAFGGFLMVEKFGYDVASVAMLYLVTTALTSFTAPRLGNLISVLGERATILMENVVLILVFIGYATINDGRIVAGLFVLDGVFFTLVIAQRTYFQKIAHPADIAPTSAVAFTINHVAAVFLPALFGFLWTKIDPSVVFVMGAGIAVASLGFALLVPRDPAPGRETVWTNPALAAPAE